MRSSPNTHPAPFRPGFLSYSYAVAYSIVDPNTKAPTAAGRALAAALAAAEAGETPALVLPVLLACSGSPVVTDFSQGVPHSVCSGGA